jgi:hypothetical protein
MGWGKREVPEKRRLPCAALSPSSPRLDNGQGDKRKKKRVRTIEIQRCGIMYVLVK